MNGYMVTLEGEWSRPNTEPEDLTGVRRAVYGLNSRLAARHVWDTAVSRDRGAPRPVPPNHYELRAEHQGIVDAKTATRRGTFKATVFVHTDTRIYVSRTRAISRAKTLFKWTVQDLVCVVPRLKFLNTSAKRA